MNLSISQILSQSWNDFTKLIVNPVVLVLFFVSSALSVIPDFIQEDTSPVLALLIIPLVFLILFLYAYQVKLLYNLKHSKDQNVFSEVLSTYPRYLWYTLIFIGIMIVATLVVAVPAAVLYFTVGNQSWVLFLDIALIVVYIPVVIYLSIRLFFYLYLIIIDKDDTPMKTSWAMTKRHLWKIILLILVLCAIILVSALVIGIVVGIVVTFLPIPTNMQDATMSIILLPLNIVASLYMTIAFLNTFLFCRARYKPQQEEAQIN